MLVASSTRQDRGGDYDPISSRELRRPGGLQPPGRRLPIKQASLSNRVRRIQGVPHFPAPCTSVKRNATRRNRQKLTEFKLEGSKFTTQSGARRPVSAKAGYAAGWASRRFWRRTTAKWRTGS